jgi:hypothetical protein
MCVTMTTVEWTRVCPLVFQTALPIGKIGILLPARKKRIWPKKNLLKTGQQVCYGRARWDVDGLGYPTSDKTSDKKVALKGRLVNQPWELQPEVPWQTAGAPAQGTL